MTAITFVDGDDRRCGEHVVRAGQSGGRGRARGKAVMGGDVWRGRTVMRGVYGGTAGSLPLFLCAHLLSDVGRETFSPSRTPSRTSENFPPGVHPNSALPHTRVAPSRPHRCSISTAVFPVQCTVQGKHAHLMICPRSYMENPTNRQLKSQIRVVREKRVSWPGWGVLRFCRMAEMG